LYLAGVLVGFFVTSTKYLAKKLQGRSLFWLMVSEVSVHHGREGGAEQSSLQPGNRKRERMPALVGFLLFLLPFHAGPQTMAWCHTPSRQIFSVVNPL
jgi:hypothetical protein